jgi:hypothetical protein
VEVVGGFAYVRERVGEVRDEARDAEVGGRAIEDIETVGEGEERDWPVAEVDVRLNGL